MTDQPATVETRRWDGEPETDADTRFFDLRESGYTGPIDQDGYAVAGRTALEYIRLANQADAQGRPDLADQYEQAAADAIGAAVANPEPNPTPSRLRGDLARRPNP